jgi:hypothetical protein
MNNPQLVQQGSATTTLLADNSSLRPTTSTKGVNLCNVNSKELIQLCWDPGGVNNSGLGASRTSSGGEYHELGCHVTLWAETGLPKWAGLKDSRYKRKENIQRGHRSRI